MAALAVVLAIVSALLPAAAAGSTAAPAAAQQSIYENPATPGLTQDPFVVEVDGTYYAYVSGFDFFQPFPVLAYTSDDLANWSQVGNVLADPGDWADGSTGFNFRSPAVRHLPGNPAGSEFVLYFTGIHSTTGDACIGVAIAASPDGPFTGEDEPLICPPGGAQDPSPLPLAQGSPVQQVVYRDNDDGAIYNQVLTEDGLSVHSDLTAPYSLYEPNPTWWHDGTVERPAIAQDSSGVYLFFSGGEADTTDRAIGWSPCQGGYGVVSSCSDQTTFGTWISGTSEVDSPSSVQVFSDADGHQWLVYDALPAGSCDAQDCTGVRNMRIDKLCFTDRGLGGPRTNAPTATPRDLGRHAGCSTDVPGADFGVIPGSVDDSTPLDQPASLSFRDGGSSVPIAGRTMWMFSDGFGQGGCPPQLTNSGGLGAPAPGATDPTWMEHLVDSDGCAQQWLPFTDEELAFNANPPQPGWRIALWEQGAIPLPNGDALAVFMKLIAEDCALCYNFVGAGVAHIPRENVEAGLPLADRDPAVSPMACNPDCLFDDANGDPNISRPFLDRGHAYFWSGPNLARVAVEDVDDRSAYEFWTDQPAPDDWTTDVDEAVPVPGLGGRVEEGEFEFERFVGQVSYNPYLDLYVNLVPKNWPDTYELYIQTAPEPWGPWDSAELLHDTSVHACDDAGVPYGVLTSPEYWMDGGRTLNGTYARPGPNWGRDPACPGQVRFFTFELEERLP